MGKQLKPGQMSQPGLISNIASYWDRHIHDLSITSQPVGSPGFFQELEDYRFDKLHYLPYLVDFPAYRGKSVLEVGCGVGTDLVRFARSGARVTGVDLSKTAIDLACANFAHNRLDAELYLMDGETLGFAANTFDVVYAHGVLPYTANPSIMVSELHRVLKPGGEAILMAYHQYSWLNLMSWLAKIPLEHEDAPVMRKFTQSELKELLHAFTNMRIVPERFPVKTRLQKGRKAILYNQLFVGTFNFLPKQWVRPLGWHLMAFARK